MADVKRHLLAVSWAMPPLVYPRAIQVSRSLKELSRRGWAIDVIALEPDSNPRELKDLAFAEQYRPFYRLAHVGLADVIGWSERHPKLNGLVSSFSSCNDLTTWAWKRRVRAKAVRLIESEQPQALVTFAQPWSDHLVGLSLKRRFPSLPWVAHFSDPWIDSPYLDKSSSRSLRIWSEQERRVVEAADSIVFVNDRTAKLVMAKYPSEWRDKVHVAPHGFDPDVMASMPSQPFVSGRPRLIYTGAMFSGIRDPMKLLEAVACLKTMLVSEKMPMVEFIGPNATAYEPKAKELGLSDFTRFSGRTSYLEALRIAKDADILLLIDTNMENSVFLPSKVADYLMLGKPIFALAPRGSATNDVLHPLRHVCVDSNDPAVIARALDDALRSHVPCRGGEARSPIGDAGAYHISNTTDGLEVAIHAAIGRRGVH